MSRKYFFYLSMCIVYPVPPSSENKIHLLLVTALDPEFQRKLPHVTESAILGRAEQSRKGLTEQTHFVPRSSVLQGRWLIHTEPVKGLPIGFFVFLNDFVPGTLFLKIFFLDYFFLFLQTFIMVYHIQLSFWIAVGNQGGNSQSESALSITVHSNGLIGRTAVLNSPVSKDQGPELQLGTRQSF